MRKDRSIILDFNDICFEMTFEAMFCAIIFGIDCGYILGLLITEGMILGDFVNGGLTSEQKLNKINDKYSTLGCNIYFMYNTVDCFHQVTCFSFFI